MSKKAVFISHGYWPAGSEELVKLTIHNPEAKELLCRLSEAVMVGSLAAKKISIPSSSFSEAEVIYLFQPFHFIKWLIARPMIKISKVLLGAINKIYQSHQRSQRNYRPHDELDEKQKFESIFEELLSEHGNNLSRRKLLERARETHEPSILLADKTLTSWLINMEHRLGHTHPWAEKIFVIIPQSSVLYRILEFFPDFFSLIFDSDFILIIP